MEVEYTNRDLRFKVTGSPMANDTNIDRGFDGIYRFDSNSPNMMSSPLEGSTTSYLWELEEQVNGDDFYDGPNDDEINGFWRDAA